MEQGLLSTTLPLVSLLGIVGSLRLTLRLLSLLKVLGLLLDSLYAITNTVLSFGKDTPVSLFDVKESGDLLAFTLHIKSRDLTVLLHSLRERL